MFQDVTADLPQLSVNDSCRLLMSKDLSKANHNIDVLSLAGKSATTAITNHIVCLARKGRVEHICFLLVLRAAKTHLPKTFKDVANLPADSKKRCSEYKAELPHKCTLSRSRQRELNKSSCCIIHYLYRNISTYCCLYIHVLVASVMSHLVVRS